jgi:hypothetical protein
MPLRIVPIYHEELGEGPTGSGITLRYHLLAAEKLLTGFMTSTGICSVA